MIPQIPLPLPPEWKDAETYVDSLLSFATSSTLFQLLCGGVHILDFLTREPDLYSTVLPEDWRQFFEKHEIGDILDLLLREDIEPLRLGKTQSTNGPLEEDPGAGDTADTKAWRNGPFPPDGLLEYIYQIRRHSLKREFTPRNSNASKIPRHVAVGMKPKKCHEVQHFSSYVASLMEDVKQIRGEGKADEESEITHIVDFGSGQNYLGRTLASPPYNKHVIAIERRQQNITGAKGKDVQAKLAKKTVVLRNKKEFRQSRAAGGCEDGECKAPATPVNDNSVTVINVLEDGSLAEAAGLGSKDSDEGEAEDQPRGHIDYIEHEIQDGYLEPIINHIISKPQHQMPPGERSLKSNPARVMVISLHSCGNLVHHGIRSLILNPSVTAIAMIGCCYNLMTERLGPQTWKLPSLRSVHPRLERTSTAFDPHGFPLSKRLEKYPYADGSGVGIRLNITARMMAVQAPHNWSAEESEAFFTRHFFRALLQRILLDYGVVPKPRAYQADGDGDGSRGQETPGTPLIVGSLRKSAFTSFPAYTRAALAKLAHDEHYGCAIQEKVSRLPDDVLNAYLQRYSSAKKNLMIVWSLMAFSAGVVEAMIVTDRWLFLREQPCVKEAWVETVFEYSQSPRNLVVVGVKK
ncbi:hypothetical protein VTO42DRAFT_2223 [Malbranchea cinnamomea]